MPHRKSGTSNLNPKKFLTGEPVRYYRPRGSQEIRKLIDLSDFIAIDLEFTGKKYHSFDIFNNH